MIGTLVPVAGGRCALWCDGTERHDAIPLRRDMLASGIDRAALRPGAFVTFQREGALILAVRPLEGE
jgi:hypothetical protein